VTGNSAVITEEESLLAAMGLDVSAKIHLHSSRASLLEQPHEARVTEGEWNYVVMPKRVAEKVQCIEVIPPAILCETSKCLSMMGLRDCGAAFEHALDADAPIDKATAVLLVGVSVEEGASFVGPNLNLSWGTEGSSVPLQGGQQPRCCSKGQPDARDGPPGIEPAVRRDRRFDQQPRFGWPTLIGAVELWASWRWR